MGQTRAHSESTLLRLIAPSCLSWLFCFTSPNPFSTLHPPPPPAPVSAQIAALGIECGWCYPCAAPVGDTSPSAQNHWRARLLLGAGESPIAACGQLACGCAARCLLAARG